MGTKKWDKNGKLYEDEDYGDYEKSVAQNTVRKLNPDDPESLREARKENEKVHNRVNQQSAENRRQVQAAIDHQSAYMDRRGRYADEDEGEKVRQWGRARKK